MAGDVGEVRAPCHGELHQRWAVASPIDISQAARGGSQSHAICQSCKQRKSLQRWTARNIDTSESWTAGQTLQRVYSASRGLCASQMMRPCQHKDDVQLHLAGKHLHRSVQSNHHNSRKMYSYFCATALKNQHLQIQELWQCVGKQVAPFPQGQKLDSRFETRGPSLQLHHWISLCTTVAFHSTWPHALWTCCIGGNPQPSTHHHDLVCFGVVAVSSATRLLWIGQLTFTCTMSTPSSLHFERVRASERTPITELAAEKKRAQEDCVSSLQKA
jgi:hypothetical protein